MYLAGVSVRKVEDITEALWGSKVSPAATTKHGTYYFRPFSSEVIYVDGIYLRRNWGGEYENAAVLVAIAVNEDGYREVLGAAEGMKEDKASWVSFFQWLRGRGLDGVKLVVGDKCLGMLEAVGEVFPVEAGVEETLTYCGFPSEHWTRIRTNNVMERLNREIRRRTRVVGCFPDGNSALMLVCARLRHVAGTQWGNKKYMNMKHLEATLEDASIAG